MKTPSTRPKYLREFYRRATTDWLTFSYDRCSLYAQRLIDHELKRRKTGKKGERPYPPEDES